MHSITQRRDPIVYCLEWLNNYKKEKPNQLMGYNLWKDDTCKGGEISHNRRSFIGANMVYIGRQKYSLGCCCAFLSCELVGPRSGLLFLAIVTHLWVSLWIPWFSAFEFVVEIWGKYPHYQFYWALHSGCEGTGVKCDCLEVVSTAVFYEEVLLA